MSRGPVPPWLRFRKRRGDTRTTPVTGVHSPRLGDVVRAPDYRIIADQSEVQIGRSVRGGTWQDVSQLANWIAARGVMEVPCYAPGVSVDELETHTFRWRVEPRFVTTRYAVSLRVCAPTDSPVNLTITLNGVASSYVAWKRSSPQSRTTTYYLDRTAQSTDVAELTLQIAGAESQPDGACLVEAISIEALPRRRIVCNDIECGVQPELFRPRNPVVNSGIHDALIDRIDNLRDVARRPGLLQFARSDIDPWSIAGSPVQLFSDGIGLLGQQFYLTDDRDAASWAVLAKCSDGSTACDVDLSNAFGGAAVATASIPAGTTSWTWVTGDDFDFDCEDNTTQTGLRLGRHDDHTFTATRTAGAGTISIATISIWS